MLFLFHKFTGIGSLNYYAFWIFKLIGVQGNNNSLLATVSGIPNPNFLSGMKLRKDLRHL